MKNLFKMKWGIPALIIAMVFMFGACEFEGDDPPDPGYYNPPVYDETSYANFSVKISNNTSKYLVVFKETITENSMVAGIPAGREQHGLKGDIFGNTVGISNLLFLTKEKFEELKAAGTLSTKGKDNLFTQLYVFWNGLTGDNTKVYDLAESLGGINRITAYNPSSTFNVELRLGGPSGQTLGYAPSGMMATDFYLEDGTYHIFPIFRRYNKTVPGRERLETIYPMRPTAGGGGPYRESITFNELTQSNERHVTLEFASAFSQTTPMSAGVAYLLIKNNTISGGSIQFEKGSTIQYTAAGSINAWNQGSQREFTIDMDCATNSTTFSESVQVDNFKIRQGTDGTAISILTTQGSSTLILKNSYQYTVLVTGNPNGTGGQQASMLSATIELTEGETNGPIMVNFEESMTF